MAQMYRFTDANGEVRLMAEIDPAPGGAQPLVGASIGLTQNHNDVNSGSGVPFDRLDFDTSAFFDAANGRFVIPAGLGGVYSVGCMMVGIADPSATFINARIDTSGNAQNAAIPCVAITAAIAWIGSGGQTAEYADGDTLTLKAFVSTVALVDVVGGGNGTVFFIQRLGDSPT